MTADQAAPPARSAWSGAAPVLTATSVVVIAITVTWVFFSMRAVMDIGGSCASGGPYVSANPCPGGAGLMAVAIPIMLLTAMFGSGVAISINAPNLLIPMWALLFGSLGWNFLEYGVRGGIVWGWLVCGVMFWLMAAPAVLGILVAIKNAVLPPATTSDRSSRWWVPAYVTLGAIGTVAGGWTWTLLT